MSRKFFLVRIHTPAIHTMKEIEPGIPITPKIIKILSEHEIPLSNHDLKEKDAYIVGYRISESGDWCELLIQIKDDSDKFTAYKSTLHRLFHPRLKLMTKILSSPENKKDGIRVVIKETWDTREIMLEMNRIMNNKIDKTKNKNKRRESRVSLLLALLSIFGGTYILYLRSALQPEVLALFGIFISFISLIITMGLVQIATFDFIRANNGSR